MDTTKSITIIGAGIAGMAAGIFARMNGFQATIFEANHKVGGVCTSWERMGYSVNGSVHWLVGSAPGTGLHELWQQLGVIEGTTFYNHLSFMEYRDIEGTDVHFYVDVNPLEKHLLAISRADKKLIQTFTEAIRTLSDAEFPMEKSQELYSFIEWTQLILGNFSAMLTMGRFNQISVGEFAQKFHSPVLRRAFEEFWSPDMSMTFLLMQLAFANMGTAGYPLGGSGKFVEKMEKRFLELGGKIIFGKKITKILVEHDQAVGIQTSDQVQYHSDYVISACDGNSVLFQMLEDKYVSPRLVDAYHALQTFPSLLFFSAGVNRSFEELPASIMGHNLALRPAIKVGNSVYERATFQIYNFDPGLSPKGKTLITAMLHTDYDYWKALQDHGEEAYQQERQRIAKELMSNLEREFAGITAQLDFTDMATPITYKSWTGNHKGSYEGWLPTPESSKIQLPTHLKGLANFYMVGHWVTPGGGMPPAALSGRNAIQLICKQERKHFAIQALA